MRYLSCILICLWSVSIFAQSTESPYLEVLTPNATIPLKETRVDAHIAGTIAHVHISQVYHNEGINAIEAQYVFPLSTQAAVHDMKMRVGGRTILAKVYERQQAQQVYEQAVMEGKRAAKLDQHRPNVFQMNVGNIMPGDEITIDVYYTEMLVPVSGSYRFVFPGVVGPRFTGESTADESTFALPYTSKGTDATFRFDLKTTLQAGMIIQRISSPSHELDIKYPDPKTAEIDLSYSNKNPANRDFVLDYSLRGGEIQSGLLLYEHEDEKFFAYMMEPIDQPVSKDIPPREYLFIVDVSGSMNGYPLDVSKSLMQNLLCNLREKDEFNILLFASSSVRFSEKPVPVNADNIESAIAFLSGQRGGGGTQLLDALTVAYGMQRGHISSARSMVVITDGYVSVEREAFDLIRSQMDQASVFTFGIGSSVNRHLIEGMAKVSHSESFVATNHTEAMKVAADFERYIATPLLTQVKFEARGFEVYDVEPISIPDVFAARPVVVYGKWRGEPTGKLVVSGHQGKGKFRQEFPVSRAALSDDNKALRYLWARKTIERLDDYQGIFHEDLQQAVTELGLSYNLVTKYTSFVAVDEVVVNDDTRPELVKQPLPMPQHVENSAIGAAADVKGKTTVRKAYHLNIKSPAISLNKTQIRQARMWVRGLYASLFRKYLEHFEVIRLSINEDGEVEKVELL